MDTCRHFKQNGLLLGYSDFLLWEVWATPRVLPALSSFIPEMLATISDATGRTLG